jgi:DNA-binding NtrC family response regulator
MKRIVVMDDEIMIQSLLKNKFKCAKYKIYTAKNYKYVYELVIFK